MAEPDDIGSAVGDAIADALAPAIEQANAETEAARAASDAIMSAMFEGERERRVASLEGEIRECRETLDSVATAMVALSEGQAELRGILSALTPPSLPQSIPLSAVAEVAPEIPTAPEVPAAPLPPEPEKPKKKARRWI